MESPTIAKAQVQEVAPYFLVPDVFATAEYYRDVLGFSFDKFFGEPPSFVIVRRDKVRIMLKQAGGAHPQAPNPRGEGQADAGFWITDAHALAAEFETRGADLLLKPTDRTIYNGREVAVRDCDGRVLLFTQLLD